MVINKKYMVYAYTSPSSKKYIGQTCTSLSIRANNGEGYKTSPKFYQAIKKYGTKKGSILAAKRILRCNPFSKGGYDPVP